MQLYLCFHGVYAAQTGRRGFFLFSKVRIDLCNQQGRLVVLGVELNGFFVQLNRLFPFALFKAGSGVKVEGFK
jgi:hypothetical protein